MIIAGFGFRAAASLESLLDAFQRAGAPQVDAIATAADKSQSPVFQDLARRLKASLIAITPEALSAAQTLTHSKIAQAHRNTGSMAEAAALASLSGGQLCAPRSLSQDRMASCAIAQGAPQ